MAIPFLHRARMFVPACEERAASTSIAVFIRIVFISIYLSGGVAFVHSAKDYQFFINRGELIPVADLRDRSSTAFTNSITPLRC